MRGRPPGPKKTMILVRVETQLMNRIHLLLSDPVRFRTTYGSLSALIESLLRTFLKESEKCQ